MMGSDQINEIASIYIFEFSRAGKGKLIWEEFRKFLRGRAESRTLLNLHAIAHFSYVMVQ